MSRPGIDSWTKVAALCALLAAGCSKDDPCYPRSLGKQFRVQVVELWDANSQFAQAPQALHACPVDFDLLPGSSFVLQVDGFNLDSTGCTCGTGKTTEGPAGWTWDQSSLAGQWRCTGSFFQGGTKASKGNCSGEVRIDINASRIPTGSSLPGQVPVASARRNFQLAAVGNGPADCPIDGTACGDIFAVEIEEL